MASPSLTRRERLRRDTLAEIRVRALAQIADGGPSAVSLNAIAKAMGMSGPAIYRYFASRDELLSALVAEGYAELVTTLETAEAAARRRRPAGRLDAVADAYRAWALAHPHRYAMLFGVRPSGVADTEAAIDTVHAGMRVLLRVLGELVTDPPPPPPAGRLGAQLARWATRHGDGDVPPAVLLLGVQAWTRIHGIVSLELAGAFADMGVDAEPLLRAELAQVAATGR